MPGAWCARSRACSVVNTRVSHHGHTGNARHSPRNGFTTYFVLSPVIGLYCHRRSASHPAKLDTSVEASGPHDFAVRFSAIRQRRTQRPSHPVPTSVTIAIRPSVGRDGNGYRLICDFGKSEYFFEEDWTWEKGRAGLSVDLPVGLNADGGVGASTNQHPSYPAHAGYPVRRGLSVL
jgi:hypothetical protein